MTRRIKLKILPILLGAAALWLSSGTASAQPQPRRNFQWGISLGLNSAYLDLYARLAILDFYGGLSAEVTLARGLALSSGLIYSRKGGEGTLAGWEILPVLTPIDLRVQYLEMPLLIKIIPTRNLYLEGGFYGAAKVGGRLLVRGARAADSLINELDAGYVLGMGGEMSFLGAMQYSGLRYSHGLSNVLPNAGTHNVTFTWVFGIYF